MRVYSDLLWILWNFLLRSASEIKAARVFRMRLREMRCGIFMVILGVSDNGSIEDSRVQISLHKPFSKKEEKNSFETVSLQSIIFKTIVFILNPIIEPKSELCFVQLEITCEKCLDCRSSWTIRKVFLCWILFEDFETFPRHPFACFDLYFSFGEFQESWTEDDDSLYVVNFIK